MSERTGLMMATMEPPSSMEEEFQEWYDTEHFPERKSCEGFVTAQRFLCLEGFPRYLALYDLSHVTVMDGPAYGATARNRYSLWTKRIVPRMWGHYRMEGEQLYPGTALLGAKGLPSRLVLWRFLAAPQTIGPAIVAGARATLDDHPGVTQTRVFQARSREESCDYIVTAELAGNVTAPAPKADAFDGALCFLANVNLYTPYWR